MDIILIGMPGSGKTTLGKIIAEKTGLDFVDLDEEIESSEKKTITEIFSSDGEAYFREKETECLLKSLGKDRIISTGGGIVTTAENIDILASSSACVVFIDKPIKKIIKNIDAKNRPLLSQNVKRIYTLFEERYKKYILTCNIMVTNNRSAKVTAKKIISKVEKYKNSSDYVND